MGSLPDISPGGGAPLPERRLSSEEFERVIRRAAELQAGSAEEGHAEGVSEAELVRIGREIGIAPEYVRRALAEVSGAPGRPPTFGERVFGPGWVTAARTVPGSSAEVAEHLEQYLGRRERLAPVRRLPGRTVYEKARGMDLARVLEMAHSTLAGQRRQPVVGAGFKLKKARRVEVSVQPLEEGYSHVLLAVDLGNLRTGLAAASLVGGGGGGTAVAVALGIAVDPAAALLGLPVLGGSLWGTRAIQLHAAARAQLHLESLLDCLERGEPLVRVRGT